MDVIEENNLPVNVLKITFSYPFPEKRVLEFLENVEQGSGGGGSRPYHGKRNY